MTDIRDQIEKNRGLIKKIQLLIPGYSGYRVGEDLRNADNYLRNQIADMLKEDLSKLNFVREKLIDHPDKDMLQSLGNLMFSVEDIEGKIRHMSLGYSGISWDIKVTPDIEERLYEYDLKLGMSVKNIGDGIGPLTNFVKTNEKDKFLSNIDTIREEIENIEDTFGSRLNDVKNIKAL